ncbi:integrated structural and functional model of the Escrt-Ii complex, partial [Jimgerdemannia flammicorona]
CETSPLHYPRRNCVQPVFTQGVSAKQSPTTPRGSGISGIANKLSQTQSETKETLKDAFKDLDGLMAMAAPMVKLAESITAKLSKEPASEGGTSEDDATSFRTYLLNLGIASPVTRDSAGAIYHTELARELAEFLHNILDREGGMMSLSDVYCIFNRARGVALISPEDLYKACSLFEQLNLPMRLRHFDSGLLVVQSLSHTDEHVARRIVEHVQSKGPLTAIKVAELNSVPLPLAIEQLLVTEKQGFICRDESVAGLTFYENLIKDYQWGPPVF